MKGGHEGRGLSPGPSRGVPDALLTARTSKGTLDKINSSLRDYLYERADFIGAIRLQNSAFKQNANTEVTTDIVFLRRLAEGERPSGPAWLDLAEHINRDGQTFQINEYFAANPHLMLGSMADAGAMYRSNEPALVPDGRELGAALWEAITFLPEGIYRNENANRKAFNGDPDLPLLCSLEDYNDETRQASKAAVFRERTIHQAQKARAAETPQDALVLTLNEAGRVDIACMETLLRRQAEEFLPELKGLIYSNPQTAQWEPDDQYLSGEVRAKLQNAHAAAAVDPRYAENVTALPTASTTSSRGSRQCGSEL